MKHLTSGVYGCILLSTEENSSTRKPTTMTTQQHRTITAINAQLEGQRAQAELNSRPVLSLRDKAQSLAVAMLAAKAAGRLDDAKALAVELKPLLSYLD